MPDEDEREMEAQEENEDEAALLHFGQYSEARAALPWDQRSFKEKVVYHADRIFIFFLALFLLVMAAESIYKVWYVTDWKRMNKLLLNVVSYLFTQEEEEELIEL